MPWVDARSPLPGARRNHGAYVDVIAHCTCGRKVRFPHALAIGIWPLSWRQRDVARTLVCMKCLGTHVAVLFRDATPSDYAVSQHVSDIPDVSAADIMIWYTAALWWKSLLVSGRLPPVIEVDLSPATDAWHIEKVWARGISGAPSVAEIEAEPSKWASEASRRRGATRSTSGR